MHDKNYLRTYDVRIAESLGLKEAIILNQIIYWMERSKNERDGHKWTFHTYEEFQSEFPHWTAKSIQRAIHNLEDAKILISDNYNRYKTDRTKWYTVDFDVLNDYLDPGKCTCHRGQMQQDKMSKSNWTKFPDGAGQKSSLNRTKCPSQYQRLLQRLQTKNTQRIK